MGRLQDELHDDLLATVRARRDLTRDDEEALIQAFLERMEARIEDRFAGLQRQVDTLAERPRPKGVNPVAILPPVLALSIPITAIVLSAGVGTGGLLLVWAAIALIVYLATH